MLDENTHFSSVVCFIHIDNEIFFIHRVEEMPTHKGDIAFIGGHIYQSESILECAYREFEEEVSLKRDLLHFDGYLDPVMTSDAKHVAVCCFELKISKVKFIDIIKTNGEWSHAFFIKSSSFLRPNKWSYTNFIKGHHNRRVYFCDLEGLKKNLWGMSASIIFSLFKNSLTDDTNNL